MIAQIATGEIEDTHYEQPNRVKGGKAGGKARAEKVINNQLTLETEKMQDDLQRSFDFYEKDSVGVYLPPQSYKGLSGFHKYWGKKPTETWRFLIENLTEQGDIVLDPFLGSGLIAKECADRERRFIGFDINPISIELTKLYLQPPQYVDLRNAIHEIDRNLKATINSTYLLSDGNIATHFLWKKDRIIKVWTKNGRKRVELNVDKEEIDKIQNAKTYKPIKLRNLRLFDNSRINSKKGLSVTVLFTPRALRTIDLIKTEIEGYSSALKRALQLILSSSLGQMSNMVFAISKRGKTKGKKADRIEVGSWVIGYWRPDMHFEINAWNCYENKAHKLLKAIDELRITQHTNISPSLGFFLQGQEATFIHKGDSEILLKDIPTSTIKVILTDPPHGDRIPYLELSELWNGVIGLDSNYEEELVVSDAKERGKDLNAYNNKLSSIFHECSRVLKKNGLLAVIFNSRLKNYWNSLHELEEASSLAYLGCYPMEYSAGSVIQDNREGSLKTDFVLLYGKDISEDYRIKILEIFAALKEWSLEYPKKVC